MPGSPCCSRATGDPEPPMARYSDFAAPHCCVCWRPREAGRRRRPGDGPPVRCVRGSSGGRQHQGVGFMGQPRCHGASGVPLTRGQVGRSAAAPFCRRYLDNICLHPEEEKYRKIKLQNRVFQVRLPRAPAVAGPVRTRGAPCGVEAACWPSGGPWGPEPGSWRAPLGMVG